MEEIMDFLSKNPTVPVVTFAAIVGLVSLRSQQHLTRAKHTLDFDKEFKEKDQGNMIEASMVLKRLSSKQLVALGAAADRTDNDYLTVVSALNIWEGVAIGIQNKVYSERLLFDAYATSVIWLFKFSTPFVQERKKHNKRLYVNFQWLGVRWSARLALSMKAQQELARKEEQRIKDDDAVQREIREKIRQELLKEAEG